MREVFMGIYDYTLSDYRNQGSSDLCKFERKQDNWRLKQQRQEVPAIVEVWCSECF